MKNAAGINAFPLVGAADPRARVRRVMPFVFTLIAIGVFLPEEFSFYLFGLRLTVIRLIYLLLAPVLVVKGIEKISSGKYRFIPSDLLVVCAGFWLIIAPASLEDLSSALNHAGPTVLEFCIGYMAPRILFSEHGHAVSFVNLLCRAIAIVALVGVLDPITGQRFTHEAAGLLVGGPTHTLWSIDDGYRLGLLRATGAIEHPILFGFASTIGLLIAASVPVQGRMFVIISCALGLIFSFSSAPMQIALLGFILLLYNHFFAQIASRWKILVLVGAVGITAAFLMSNSLIGFIITNLTFSPQSGYYREWTWEMVGIYVSQSPWVGLGYGEMPAEINHTIDSLWLVLAIQSGWPGSLLVGLSLLGAAPVFTKGRTPDLMPVETKLAATLGILLCLTVLFVFTVHLWGSVWVLLGLLLGMKAHLSELAYLSRSANMQ